MPRLRTQKARSVRALRGGSLHSWSYNRLVGPTSFAVHVLPHEAPASSFELPAFARPCPVRPRHGFVSSRVVWSLRDIFRVFAETLRADPDGELIVMDRLTAKASGVLTNAGVAFGFGNDGVTGATSEVCFISAETPLERWLDITRAGEVGIETNTYVELVEHEGRFVPTQLRDGPPQSTQLDYVPADTVVRRIIAVDTDLDLLTWEQEVRELSKKRNRQGVVFHFPRGCLSSHYAIHCIEARMPVVCSSGDPPKPGETLTRTENRSASLTRRDYLRLGSLIDNWTSPRHIDLDLDFEYEAVRTVASDLLHTCIACTHTASRWGNTDVEMLFRAITAVYVIRFMAAACVGEARHWSSSGPGGSVNARPSLGWERLGLPVPGAVPAARPEIYARMLGQDFELLGETLQQCEMDFNGEGWERGGEPGTFRYGGPRWGEAAAAGVRAVTALATFQEKPTAGRWSKLWAALNNCIHIAHNHGKIFTKWVSQRGMRDIADAPAIGFCNLFAFKIAMGVPLKEDFSHRVPFSSTFGTRPTRRGFETTGWVSNVMDRYMEQVLRDGNTDALEHAFIWRTTDEGHGFWKQAYEQRDTSVLPRVAEMYRFFLGASGPSA